MGSPPVNFTQYSVLYKNEQVLSTVSEICGNNASYAVSAGKISKMTVEVWSNACMEVAGLASSITNPCEGRGASFVFVEEVLSSGLAGVVPRVRPCPLNGTYLGSGGACNTQQRHRSKHEKQSSKALRTDSLIISPAIYNQNTVACHH